MSLLTSSQLVLACYEKSCAPPPAGKGGSSGGGKKEGRRPDALDRKVAEWKRKGLVKTPKPSTKHNWTDPRDGTPKDSPYYRK